MKNLSLLFPALMLSGCFPIISGTPPIWETPCKLIMRGGNTTGQEVQGWSYQALETIEAMAIQHGIVTCDQLAGYQVIVHLEGAYDPGGYPHLVNGTTYCNFLMPRMEGDVYYPGVLFHEMHHVAQRCDAPGPRDPDEDPNHADWTRTGARAQIAAATEEYLKIARSGELGSGAIPLEKQK